VFDALAKVLGLGLEPKELTLSQVGCRAVVIFLAAMIIVRVADRRFLAKMTALDAILAFILGSTMARAINGSAALFPTIAAGFVLVALHRMLCMLTYRFPALGRLVKGDEQIVVKQGHMDETILRENHISQKDLLEELRLNGKVADVKDVETATIERSGEISVIPKEKSS